MKICGIEILHADGGWRTLSFLKVLTDDRLVGWSEFHESFAEGGMLDYGFWEARISTVGGPRVLMEAVRDMTGHWPSDAVHFEDFGSDKTARVVEQPPILIRLVRSGATLEVPAMPRFSRCSVPTATRSRALVKAVPAGHAKYASLTESLTTAIWY